MTLAKSAALQVCSDDSPRGLDLPEGWAFPKVGEILAVNYGKGLKKAKRMSGPIPVYGSNGVVGNHDIPLTHGPTIILGRKGTVGAVHFSKVPCWPIDTTYFIDKFNGLAPRYLMYALRRLNLSRLDTSTAIPGLNRDELYSQYLPLAPKAEQKHIVAKVEQLLARVNAARERLAKVPEILKRFRQSVLAAACSGRLTADWRNNHPGVEPADVLLKRIHSLRKNHYEEEVKRAMLQGGKKPQKIHEFKIYRDQSPVKGWVRAKLNNLIYIAGRIGWRGLKAEEYTNDGPLFLSVHSLNYGEEVDYRDALHISKERYDESLEIRLQEDDILLAKDGAGIGKIGIVKNLPQLATVNSSLLVIRGLEAFVPKFLFYFLSGPELQNLAQQRITGSATPHLFQKDIKEFVLSIPPTAEQEEIVRRVEALFKLADKIKKRVMSAIGAIALADKLTQAIMAKALRGELVPTEAELARREGRSYEPASALLAKIQSQRKDVKPQRKRGRSRQRRNK